MAHMSLKTVRRVHKSALRADLDAEDRKTLAEDRRMERLALTLRIFVIRLVGSDPLTATKLVNFVETCSWPRYNFIEIIRPSSRRVTPAMVAGRRAAGTSLNLLIDGEAVETENWHVVAGEAFFDQSRRAARTAH
jgi:hypothetical protein